MSEKKREVGNQNAEERGACSSMERKERTVQGFTKPYLHEMARMTLPYDLK